MKPFWKFTIHDRDLFLRTVLAEEIIRPRHEAKRLCVKYGAKHMSVLAQTFLKDFGYTLVHSRDVLAIKKTKRIDVSKIETGYGFAQEKYFEEMAAKREQIKEKITELTVPLSQSSIFLNVKSVDSAEPVSLSIQTDYSNFLENITPANVT